METKIVDLIKVLGEIAGALTALALAINGLIAVLVNKIIPILHAKHPMLPLVKLLGSFVNRAKPVNSIDRPDAPVSVPVTKIVPIFIFALLFCGVAHAQVAIFDGLTAKQGVLYLVKDAKTKNVTTFQLMSTTHVDSWGTWGTVLWDGMSLDAGIDYDALNSIDGGSILLGKDFSALIGQIPVDFPLKNVLHLTVYPVGDCISKGEGDSKVTNQFCFGGAILKAEWKF